MNVIFGRVRKIVVDNEFYVIYVCNSQITVSTRPFVVRNEEKSQENEFQVGKESSVFHSKSTKKCKNSNLNCRSDDPVSCSTKNTSHSKSFCYLTILAKVPRTKQPTFFVSLIPNGSCISQIPHTKREIRGPEIFGRIRTMRRRDTNGLFSTRKTRATIEENIRGPMNRTGVGQRSRTGFIALFRLSHQPEALPHGTYKYNNHMFKSASEKYKK